MPYLKDAWHRGTWQAGQPSAAAEAAKRPRRGRAGSSAADGGVACGDRSSKGEGAARVTAIPGEMSDSVGLARSPADQESRERSGRVLRFKAV